MHIQTVLMTTDEARQCIDKIQTGIVEVRGLLVELDQREGWRALGYESMRECILGEFADASASYVYRQLSAGKTEQALFGEVGGTKESHLRPLSILKNDEQKMAAWHIASATEKMTANDVDRAARFVAVDASKYSVLSARMRAGDISPLAAYGIMTELDGMVADKQMIMLCELCTDPSIIPLLRRLQREKSQTWDEIASTGCIPSAYGEQIPIQRAHANALLAYLDVASNEHRAASIAAKREEYDAIREAMGSVVFAAREACKTWKLEDETDYEKFEDDMITLEFAVAYYDELLAKRSGDKEKSV